MRKRQNSETNESVDLGLSLFQICIIPNKKDVARHYDQKYFSEQNRKNKLQILVTTLDETHEEGFKIHQDVVIYRIDLAKDKILNIN